MARSSNSLPAFLLALRQSIVAAKVVSDTCCQVATAERTLQYPQGEYLVMLIPGELTPEDQGGAGIYETIFRGRITFRLVCQTILDTATSDVTALTDSSTTVGLYVLFTNLLPVIRFWDQGDSQGNAYLMEPMRLSSGLSQPQRSEEHSQYVTADLMAEFRICIATGGSNR